MAIGTPVAPYHNLTVLSHDPEASQEPSGRNDKDVTEPECPSRVAIGAPVAPSHNLTVLLHNPEASRVW